MAIEPIVDRYHGFIFDGENSRDYGVYITEPAVFGSPERDVEYIAIPGRNGDYVRDNGRYKNITVTYKCAIGANVDTDFNNAISDLRNMLGSKRGYKRLSDEINTGEYRMANFSAGVDVANINPRTGEFEVAFICKPQRFLTSGEEEVTLTPGGTTVLENPTRMDASPILDVVGHGNITFGTGTIQLKDTTLGRVLISDELSVGEDATSLVRDIPLNADLMNAGDPFQVVLQGDFDGVFSYGNPVSISMLDGDSDLRIKADYTWNPSFPSRPPQSSFLITSAPYDFVWGTAKTYSTRTNASVTVQYAQNSEVATFGASLEYIPASNILRVSLSGSVPHYPYTAIYARQAVGQSTKGRTATTHIDLETGEAWAEEGGVTINLDDKLILPDVLPTIPPGESEVTADSRYTSAIIKPRWWKL